MRVDWCVSSWFRIKNTHSLTHRELTTSLAGLRGLGRLSGGYFRGQRATSTPLSIRLPRSPT